MTDPRYAPGLAAAKTPRQAIEAIAAGGYAGGEADYPSKIIRIMQQMGVNVDQPYKPAPPARNTSYMGKTLAYITDGIMPGGGFSEHTDIKQQDNPNTPANERLAYFKDNALDNFVEFNDPEFGNITLSELRRRIPIAGGGFYDMRDGGTRQHAGYDYGTKKGTKLYLKNGARVVSKSQTQWGSMVIIQLPDGRRFSFLHGKSV
jgi:murein DD-endopeptidase MepM/ murein hydrolase activator NlpD